MNKKNTTLVAVALLVYATQGFADTNTDLQMTKPPQPTSSDSKALPQFQPPSALEPVAGGVTVKLNQLEISGNKSLSTETLLAQLNPVAGRSFDMAGLTAIANTLSNYYHAAGYPFAQVFLPPQDLQNGVLHITVIEGSYGKVAAVGNDKLLSGAQRFLAYGLQRGDAIQNQKLERTLLILDDQPGMTIRPIIRPGSAQGEADLLVDVKRESYVSGEVGVDNTGASSTGEYRAHAALFLNSAVLYGDKLSLNSMYTDEDMWLGAVDYEAPLGASGLRGRLGYAHTSYQLGGEFAALGAQGGADITTAKLSYPLLRSQANNLLISLSLQHKSLQDDYRASNIVRNKRSDGATLGLQFDKRDAVWGGGVTYGSLSVSGGQLRLDGESELSDAVTAGTNGSFGKVNLDIARIQKIAGGLNAYGRFSGQWANKNLDSSEKFSLGGYYGVRAYPLGEGVGDSGWFTQLELRYTLGAVTPFILYDYGKSTANTDPWDSNSAASRTIAGAGFGARLQYVQWSVDGSLAWRSQGGRSEAENVDKNPRFFLMLGRKF